MERKKPSGFPRKTLDLLSEYRHGQINRRAFLDGYRHALAGSHRQFVPEDDEGFARALAAWELDKALYEVAYEARNRPNWLDLPLRSLLPDVLDQAADTAGGAPA